MTLQSGLVAMTALGVDAHPLLRAGIHLRWIVRPSHGIPPLGFDLFRRAHRPGTPRVLDFSAEQRRTLSRDEVLGTTRWNTTDFAPELDDATVSAGTVTALWPGRSALTCRFDPADGLVRRVELDLVHEAATRPNSSPVPVTIWGVAGNERVASGGATFTYQNLGQIVTVAIMGDALDGFQLWAGRFGIVRVRWTLVSDEADQGWTTPLNPRRIGFPLSLAGYLVPHRHSPDAGQGHEDWLEASDRLRDGLTRPAGGPTPALPAELAARYAPPAFAEFRRIMREALAGAALSTTPTVPTEARVSVGAVETTLLLAMDPDAARLFGYGLVDAAAAIGPRYDYRVVAYWPGRRQWTFECIDVPPTTPESPPPPPNTPVVVTLVPTGAAPVVSARLLAGLESPKGVNLRRVPGLAIFDDDTGAESEQRAVPSSIEILALGESAVGEPSAGESNAGVASVVVATKEPAPRLDLTFTATPTEPLLVIGIAGGTITSVTPVVPAGAGEPTTVTVTGPGVTTVVVTGTTPVVTTVCRLRLVQVPVTEEWITFDVTRGPVPALAPPGSLAGRALPGFARDGGGAGTGEQVAGLTIEPARPAPRPFDLFPLARLPLDAVAYELERRDDGNAPLGAATTGMWSAIPRDPATGRARPVIRAHQRPPAHRAPPGWPIEPQDFVDGMLDPDVRYVSYRARGRDLFGRVSAWTAPLTIDAADRVGPPSPDVVAARWIDRAQPRLDADDAALLDARGVTSGVRLRWRWRPERRAQAPDARGFRLYWNGTPLSTLAANVTSAQQSGDAWTVAVTTPLATAPANAFVGDWLRQGVRQYLIRASSVLPLMLTVSGAGMPAPSAGPCVLSLRGPDPQRLDLLGNPLRRDAGRAIEWERRLAEVAMVRHDGAAAPAGAGAAVQILRVAGDVPRPGLATLTLDADWRWSGGSDDTLGTRAIDTGGARWQVLSGTLARSAALIVDAANGAPAAGAATLVDTATTLSTVRLPALALAPNALVALVGGTLVARGNEHRVLAHRAVSGGHELLVDGAVGANVYAVWYPDYEVLLTGLTLAVTPDAPLAIGAVGVSAVDGRAYAADMRTVAGEPTLPGNEGPVASMSVERRWLGGPAASPGPNVPAPVTELWADPPDAFSGVSRFALRWTPAAGVGGYVVHRASLDAVLNADAEDRAAARGAYVGQPPLAGAALAQFRDAQGASGAAALMALATAQDAAFEPMTEVPLAASDPQLVDPTSPNALRWLLPLDGSAPGRWFLRIQAVDAAGHRGPLGSATPPVVVPDVRRPAPPRLRRVIGGDRTLWLVWDAPEPTITTYRIHRTALAAGATPDVRDMPVVDTVAASESLEPLAVFGGSVRLPFAPADVVSVYRAELYDATLAANAQTTPSVVGAAMLVGKTLTGLSGLSDGTLVFVVVRETAGATPTLAVSPTARAWLDSGAFPDTTYQYRVVAERVAAVGAAATRVVRSLPSEVAEGASFDASPPVPPAGAALWDAAGARVHLTWATAGLPAGFEVLVQRTDVAADLWRGVSQWVPASAGAADDATAATGRSYLYRLHVRNAARRVSDGEPAIGPVAIP